MSGGQLTAAMTGLARLALEEQAIAGAVAAAESIVTMNAPPKTQAAMLAMVDSAKAARLARLDLKKRMAKITDPLKEAMAAVNEEAAPRMRLFQQAEDMAKSFKTQYDELEAAARAAKQAETQRQANLAATTAALPGEDPAPAVSVYTPPPPNKVQASIGAMHARKVARVRITDPLAAMMANPDLFELNQAAAVKACQAALPGTVIGLELYYETTQVMS